MKQDALNRNAVQNQLNADLRQKKADFREKQVQDDDVTLHFVISVVNKVLMTDLSPFL